MTYDKAQNVQQPAWEQSAPPDGVLRVLDDQDVAQRLRGLPQWQHNGGAITRTYRFEGFRDAIIFAIAVGWIADAHNHHPTLEVSPGRCALRYRTHRPDGITHKDFVGAARADHLYAEAGRL